MLALLGLWGGSFIGILLGVLSIFIPEKIFHVIYSIVYKTSGGYNQRTDEAIVSEKDALHHIDRAIVVCFIFADLLILAGMLIQIFA